MKTHLLWIACIAGFVLSSGCVHHESNVVRDSDRARVEFENETAAKNFFEGMQRGGYSTKQTTTSTKFELPIIFEYRKNVTSGANAGFNRAVQLCDSNKDGKITELESKIFLNNPKP